MRQKSKTIDRCQISGTKDLKTIKPISIAGNVAKIILNKWFSFSLIFVLFKKIISKKILTKSLRK